MNKIGTITICVYREENDITNTTFSIQADNENVLPVSYVIEDTLKLY